MIAWIIGLVFTLFIITTTYIFIKAARDHTSTEIDKLHRQLHEGIGKISLLTDELQKTNQNFDLNRKKYHP